MARPFRLFSQYDFFSVFLPGLAMLMGIYVVLPQNFSISPLSALIPVLVLSFVFGQALHAFAVWAESHLEAHDHWKSHREVFAKEVIKSNEGSDQDYSDYGVELDQFREECSVLFKDSSILSSSRSQSEEEWKLIYPTIQSTIYNSEVGRSRSFQAIYAFSRSMFLLFVILPAMYIVYSLLTFFGVVPGQSPKYLFYFPSFV